MAKKTINFDKHIYEGWTVGDFIKNLELTIGYRSFKNKQELKEWCKSEQPYYKKHIPEVVDYFAEKLNL